MKANILPFPSLNDIVFEGRNKAYGAYALRQNYNRELFKAAGISFSTAILLFASLYGWVQSDMGNKKALGPSLAKSKVTEFSVAPVIPIPEIPEPAKPARELEKSAAIVLIVPSREFRKIKIVTDYTPVTQIIPSQADFSAAEPGFFTATSDLPGTTAVAEPEGAGKGTDIEPTTPFVGVEQMPEFPEGIGAMYKFINKHLRYPAPALAQGLEGTVILTFVISATGQISDIRVLQDIGGGTAEEAIRVINKMPDWRPGKQNKRNVPVRFTLPVKFKLH